MTDKRVGKILSIAGKALIEAGAELGLPGLALRGIGAIARKLGKAIDNGMSVDEILRGLEKVEDIPRPWHEDGESTARETPKAKKP